MHSPVEVNPTNIWNRRGITTKIKVYKAIVLKYYTISWLWILDSLPAPCQKLNYFHTASHRKLLDIKCQYEIEVLRRAKRPSINTTLHWCMHSYARQAMLSACQIIDSPLKKLLYGELQLGNRSYGGQKNRFNDTLKASDKAFNISPYSLEPKAMDWDLNAGVRQSASALNCVRPIELPQQSFLTRLQAPSAATIPCLHCHWMFRALIDLIRHLRIYELWTLPACN